MSTRFLASLCLLSVATLPSEADAQDVLRWKFRRGEQVRYNVQQNMETMVEVGDNQINQAMKQSMDMSWHVLEVAAGGDAVMNQVVERIQMKMAGGPMGEITFDTAKPEKSENPMLNSMGEVFRKIVNQNFKVSMKPTGEVGNVEIPPELLKAVQASAAGNPSALNEDTLKQMMQQSAVTLPANKVSKGSKWVSEQNVRFPFGTMNIKSSMTLVETDSAGNAIIDIVPSITVTAREGAPVKMSITESTGQGRVTFGIAEGRVMKSQLNLQMVMKIDTGQQVLNQTIKQQTSLTLVP